MLAELTDDIVRNFEQHLEALLPVARERLAEILAPGGAKPADQLRAIELVITRTQGLPVSRNVNLNFDSVAVAHVTQDELTEAAKRVLGGL
jgi:hypothetical protein